MIELVGENEAALRHDLRQVEAVGGKTHPDDDGVLRADKFSNSFFQLSVDAQSSQLEVRIIVFLIECCSV